MARLALAGTAPHAQAAAARIEKACQMTPDDTTTALVLAPETQALVADMVERMNTLAVKLIDMQTDMEAERSATQDAIAELRAEVKRLKWRAQPWWKRIADKLPE